MTRYHMTAQGEVPFTAAEEIEADQREAEHAEAAASNLIAAATVAVQKRLDDWAKGRNYDGILSLCTYATSSIGKFALEGQRGVDNRDATWSACYAIMGEVQAGTRPMPTVDELIADLPELLWPGQ